MQAYSRTSDKPQLKRFRKETKYPHLRSDGMRGMRGFFTTGKQLRQTDPRGEGYVNQG